MCADMSQVHFLTNTAATLLRWLKTQQTDWQYSFYNKNVEGCLSSEIICVELDTLKGLQLAQKKQQTSFLL